MYLNGFRPTQDLIIAIGLGELNRNGWSMSAVGYGRIDPSGNIMVKNQFQGTENYAYAYISMSYNID